MAPRTNAAFRDRLDKLDNKRFDKDGEVRSMARAEKYVMCRRPGRMPFVVSAETWDEMSRIPLKD